jgi:very-short-patch-repair endonuclease
VDEVGLTRLLRAQDGVISRAQVLTLGGTAADIRRRRRRREWATVHPGVYVHHTGPLTTRQRQWAAVLACGDGAALHRASALEAEGLVPDRGRRRGPVDVAVDASRHVVPPSGVRVERIAELGTWTRARRRPPRVCVELAALKEASGRDRSGAIAAVADVCREGRTTPERLLDALERLPRLPGRAWLTLVLDDVASGVHSVLEHRYLDTVELAHGLPRGQRQRREVTADGVVVRDVLYEQQATVVELDGRFGHTDTDDRWDDLDRDVLAAAAGRTTLRLGWRQVLQPCRLAGRVAAVLEHRGWSGTVARCGPGCTVDRGGSGSPGDPDPPASVSGAAER